MKKRFTRISALPKYSVYLSALLLFVIVLSACTTAATPQPVIPTATAQTAATATTVAPATAVAPVATATQAVTPTQAVTATEAPTATTAPTEVPTLALVSDGFKAWCAPESYAGTLPTSPDAVSGARLLTVKNNQMQVQIPAAYCVVTFQFNQAAPAGLQVIFYDAKNPFLKLPLTAVTGHPEEVWAVVRHDYVINPPVWYVTYTVALATSDGKELTTNPVKFAKSLPPTCIYTNQLPDPVTGWCPISDPWEIEPHPDAKYPYDRSRLLTPHPN